jgi:hypothetical protein
VLDAQTDRVVADPRLDAAFGVRFQRVPIDLALGPLLPTSPFSR